MVRRYAKVPNTCVGFAVPPADGPGSRPEYAFGLADNVRRLFCSFQSFDRHVGFYSFCDFYLTLRPQNG